MDELIEDFQDPEEIMEPCIFCGSDSGCEHLVFIYDLSFSECVAGHCDELTGVASMISETFLKWLTDNREIQFPGDKYDHHLTEMWDYAADNYITGEDYTAIEWFYLMELIVQLLEEELGVLVFPFGSGGAPCFDSAMVVCYAENPAGVLGGVERIIRGYLVKAVVS
jgi:hypothetical protein